jgi:hypothetical protein
LPLSFINKYLSLLQDKDALTAYKLNLKKKLCSRAGTRPSAKARAAAAARAQNGEGDASTSADHVNLNGDGEFDPEFDPDVDNDHDNDNDNDNDNEADRDGDDYGMDGYDFDAEGKAPAGESPRGSSGSSKSVHEELENAGKCALYRFSSEFLPSFQ